MPYVSDELTHFVGRSLRSDEDRFQLLLRIISSGQLYDPAHKGRRDRIFSAGLRNRETGAVDAVEYSSVPNVRHDLATNLSDNTLVQFETVCFCDIPFADLPIHCAKYSYFGLAFSKRFLVKRGASPVMYVPRSAPCAITLREHHVPSGEQFYEEHKAGPLGALFDELFSRHNALGLLRYQQMESELAAAKNNDEVDNVVQKLRTMLFYQTAMEANIFGHLKFWDPTLAVDDANNFYMEREWRVNGRVEFSIGDIQRVLVPPEFVDPAIGALPELAAYITALTAG
jgi:hypothetical protein